MRFMIIMIPGVYNRPAHRDRAPLKVLAMTTRAQARSANRLTL
jgi:hypothetical protein